MPNVVQQLVDAAAPGAVVRLPPGTHQGTVVVRKPLTLLGASPQSVLDGGGKGPCLVIEPAPGAKVSLIQLVLQNGVAQQGGCLFARHGQVTVSDCVLRGGKAAAFGGGGLYAICQTLTVERTQVLGCEGKQGGGVLLDEMVKARFVSTLIADNKGKLGGGLRVKDGVELVLEGCTLAGNTLLPEGHGSQLYGSGTLTRKPKITLRNSILAGGTEAFGTQAEFPAAMAGSHLLLPEGVTLEGVSSVLHGSPGFQGQGHAPYALARGSPAIGAGQTEGVPPESKDLLGNPRMQRGRVDLGAYTFLE